GVDRPGLSPVGGRPPAAGQGPAPRPRQRESPAPATAPGRRHPPAPLADPAGQQHPAGQRPGGLQPPQLVLRTPPALAAPDWPLSAAGVAGHAATGPPAGRAKRPPAPPARTLAPGRGAAVALGRLPPARP